jgi:hypothetical protein
MRKASFDSATFHEPRPPQESWLDLDNLAHVAVTSEEPDFPVESAFLGLSAGWRASGRGEQTIRLIFDPPRSIKRIWLRFVETENERTQEFLLRWRPDKHGRAREIVRQQWNFSPSASTAEIEDYRVDLADVGILELSIIPSIGERNSVATLAEWRIA